MTAKLRLSVYSGFILCMSVGLLQGYQMGKHQADKYYQAHPTNLVKEVHLLPVDVYMRAYTTSTSDPTDWMECQHSTNCAMTISGIKVEAKPYATPLVTCTVIPRFDSSATDEGPEREDQK